jgi:hypothetical protein
MPGCFYGNGITGLAEGRIQILDFSSLEDPLTLSGAGEDCFRGLYF